MTAFFAKTARSLAYKLGYILGAARIGFNLGYWHASNRWKE